MKATPIVAIVDQELPVSTEINAHTTQAVTRNNVGVSTSRPYTIKVGTTPLTIHVVATIAMQMSIGTAGRIWRALRTKPTIMPRRDNAPNTNDNTTDNAAEPRSTTGEYPAMASAPSHIIINTRLLKRTIIGNSDTKSGTRLAWVPLITAIFNLLKT